MRNAMDILAEKGFVPVIPPVLVREEAMYGTGFLPTDAANIYRTAEDDLYLVGTAEVPLAALHMGEILDEADLPAALRRVLHLLPARGRHLRQGHGRDVPRPPVRQGGDVLVRDAGGQLGRARVPRERRGGDPREPRAALPRGEHRGGRPGRCGREEVRHRGLAARARSATGSSRPARTPPTTRRGGCRPACAAPTARSRRCTR